MSRRKRTETEMNQNLREMAKDNGTSECTEFEFAGLESGAFLLAFAGCDANMRSIACINPGSRSSSDGLPHARHSQGQTVHRWCRQGADPGHGEKSLDRGLYHQSVAPE